LGYSRRHPERSEGAFMVRQAHHERYPPFTLSLSKGEDVENAILREKQIKGGSREKKIKLIDTMNKEWRDLYEEL